MIDTLMVLWTKGILTRIIRLSLSFLLLLTGICLALFLATMSGIKWPGLAFNAAPSNISRASADSSLSPTPITTPGTAFIAIPVILHNPTPTAILSTPEPRQTTGETRPAPTAIVHPAQSSGYYAHPSVPRATPPPTQEPTAQPTMDDDTPSWFSNAISANGRLAGSLITPASISALPGMFWFTLLASVLLALCGLSLMAFTRHKKGPSAR